ncbi:uncharacterized protein LY79DRAFT_557091 [Colletotrichum navitas]|uniref:Uncharacterized protein n=1 Tax=Colletotrichum navitas TaxID=681940 RepID=A0AAD8V294_9PEZI|nr:uncharacterized protein LY79DRAFT_557091 [Colletotrichum navitas]KAK1586191.1 hypothetical protein LY79DRAFT_557091 [Colletotrichum navitas]
MQRSLDDRTSGKTEEIYREEIGRWKAIDMRLRGARGQIPPEPPTKLSRPDLSFLNDDQHDQKSLPVAVSREQLNSRHTNQQSFQTDEDVSRAHFEAYSAREQSKQKIRELWKTQRPDVIEEDKASAETRRAQFFLDLERAQKEFDLWDDRVMQISLATGRRRFFQPHTHPTKNHLSNRFNLMPSQPESKPQSPPLVIREPLPVPKREVLRRKHSMESEKEPRTSKPSPTVDVQVNPKARRDVTLHLDLDVTQDVEEELEEFSKLRRIGHFNAAKRYFEEHLERCIDNAYVLDQYGQFLLEISDIHTLTKLAREYPPGDLEKAASANWFLVRERAHQFDDEVCPRGGWQKTPNLRKLLQNWPKLDSTELQCLINDLRVVKHAGATEGHNADEYGELYAHLQHEDRIWDFRDLCYGLLAVKSLEETIHCLFSRYLSSQNENAPEVTQVIQQHWEGSAGDEVTSLALLDIFTAFTMWALDAANSRYETSLDDSEELQTAKTYLKIAQHYATGVLRQNPLNLKSRPYLQWVVAKVLVEKNTDTARCGQATLVKYLSNLRGESKVSSGAFRGLLSFQDDVYYTPNQDEAPDWQPDSSIAFSYEQEKAILMVVRNARELGDVMLEAACLQQLKYSSPNPEAHLVDLCNLWRSVGNRSGLLRAYFYRYILKRSPGVSNDLRSNLLEFGDAECNVDLQKTRFMILRALSNRSYEKTVYLKRARDLEDEPGRLPYDRGQPQPSIYAGTKYSAKNSSRQASFHSVRSSSDWTELSDDNDRPMRSQSPSLHNVERPMLNKEETSLENERKWLKEQDSTRRMLADHADSMAQQPETNSFLVRGDSMETSKGPEALLEEKNILNSDSQRTTKGFGDGEGIINVDNDEQRCGKEKIGQ